MKTTYEKFLFLLLFFPLSLMAQNILKGTVTDKVSGLPLPGVSVTIQGGTSQTSTDFDGNFTLTDVNKGDVVNFSFIGFNTYTLVYEGQTTVTIAMVENTSLLDEVVVVGYGSVKKKDITGAVSKVTADQLNQGTLVDPIQGLQGKAAGVVITKQGGDPNAGFDVRIRGAAGFAASGSPLYVVDGIRGVDITTIAPEDIVSYDVMKDAASTAIYGADGANGVVFITTKRGREGATTIEYNAYVALDNVANRLDLLSASQYRQAMADKGISFIDNGGNIDWQDELYRTGLTYNHNVAISGGTEKSNYRASITHTDFEGVIKGTEKKRTTGKLDITQKSFDNRLTIDMGGWATIEANHYVNYGGNGGTDVLFQSFQRLPTDPIYNADGTYFESSMFNYFNPVASRSQIQNVRDAKRLNGYTNFNLEIISGLHAKLALSYIRNDSESTYFEPKYTNNMGGQPTLIRQGYGRRNYGNWEQGLMEATLNYNKTFNEKHNLAVVAGYSYRATDWDGFSGQGRKPISNLLGADDMQQFEDVLLGDIDSYKAERKDIGLFARASYDYNSKYYLTATIRRDGSSVFGKDNQWGIFPSVQVAWNVANESFITENFSTLNMFKIRASYGMSGNSNIPVGVTDLRVGYVGVGVDPDTGDPIVNLNYYSNANPDLQWDENHELNLGVDFGLFNDRISGSVEYYKKDIKNMLIANNNIPIETNFSGTTYINGGHLENKGIELTLSGRVFDNDNFKWTSTLIYSSNKQTVKSLGNGYYDYDFIDVGYISGPGLVGVSTQRMDEGYQLGTFYGFEYAGVSNGQWLIRGNDGELHYLSDVSQSDEHKKVIGNALPDFEMGWSNYFKYKNWDLSMSFRAVVGHDIYNATNMVFGNPDYLGVRNVNSEAVLLNGTVQGAYSALSYYIEDGSFLRLDNINLGYNFNNPKIMKGISKLRLYAAMNNVFTLTNYGGIDPEINFSGGNGSNEIYFGNDQYNIYPKTRTITFGLNVAF